MGGLVAEYRLPSLAARVNPITIGSWSAECASLVWSLAFTTNAASAAWTANLVTYVPFSLAFPLRVSQFFWYNGATVNGSTDVGIYAASGATKLGSTTATGNSGTSAIQIVDVTDFTLPGNTILWLALSSDSGTQTYWRKSVTAATIQSFAGIKQQTGGWSSGLPASATFADPSVAFLPLFGFTGGSV